MSKIKILKALIKGEILQQIRYKVFFISFLLTSLLQMLIVLSVWGIISDDQQLITYIFIATIISFMYKTDMISFMGYYVKSGDISILLIKPFSLVMRLYALFLANVIIQFVVIVMPTFLIFTIFTPSLIANLNYIKFFITLIIGLHIYFLYTFLISQCALKLTNTWGLIQFDYVVKNFFSGVIIPLSLFPEQISQIILLLPFATFVNYPIEVAMGTISFSHVILIDVVWLILLILINYCFYHLFFKKSVEVLGG